MLTVTAGACRVTANDRLGKDLKELLPIYNKSERERSCSHPRVKMIGGAPPQQQHHSNPKPWLSQQTTNDVYNASYFTVQEL